MDKRSMLRVSSTTSVKKLASAIMMALENSAQIEVTAIGASAVNTAVKGIASANGLAAMSNHVLKATPFFKIVSLAIDQGRIQDVQGVGAVLPFKLLPGLRS